MIYQETLLKSTKKLIRNEGTIYVEWLQLMKRKSFNCQDLMTPRYSRLGISLTRLFPVPQTEISLTRQFPEQTFLRLTIFPTGQLPV